MTGANESIRLARVTNSLREPVLRAAVEALAFPAGSRGLDAACGIGLVALFEMRWPGVEPELSPEDWAAYGRLCLPASPDFVVDHPDYYAFFT